MKIKKNNIIISFYFLSLINLIFNPINILIALIPLIAVFFFSLINSTKYLVISSVIIYPFWFLIRNEYENIYIILLPELTIIFCFILNFIVFRNFKIKMLDKYIFYSLILYLIFSILISLYHIKDINFLIPLIRMFLIPLLFLITLLSVLKKNKNILKEVLHLGILSFGFISILALLNHFEFIFIEIKYHNLGDIKRSFLSSENQYTRLDLNLSGAWGSAAAIIFSFGSILIFLKKEKFYFFNYTFLGIIMIFTSILTLSYSVVLSLIIIFVLLIFSIQRKWYYNLALALCSLTVIYFLINIKFFLEESLLDYFLRRYLKTYIEFISNIEISEFLFGFGTRIIMGDFIFEASKSILDIGIFRVLTETGIFNFSLLIYIILMLFIKLQKLIFLFPSNFNKSLLILFVIFLSLTHANVILLPPFYPIFLILICNIMNEYNLKFKK